MSILVIKLKRGPYSRKRSFSKRWVENAIELVQHETGKRDCGEGGGVQMYETMEERSGLHTMVKVCMKTRRTGSDR